MQAAQIEYGNADYCGLHENMRQDRISKHDLNKQTIILRAMQALMLDRIYDE
jgi:hypothetical protein